MGLFPFPPGLPAGGGRDPGSSSPGGPGSSRRPPAGLGGRSPRPRARPARALSLRAEPTDGLDVGPGKRGRCPRGTTPGPEGPLRRPGPGPPAPPARNERPRGTLGERGREGAPAPSPRGTRRRSGRGGAGRRGARARKRGGGASESELSSPRGEAPPLPGEGAGLLLSRDWWAARAYQRPLPPPEPFAGSRSLAPEPPLDFHRLWRENKPSLPLVGEVGVPPSAFSAPLPAL